MSIRIFILCCRCLMFGVFVICNAIICSLSVWNLTIAESVGGSVPVDIYLIFLGAFSLIFVIPIIFIEIWLENPLTSRLWFECCWVGFFWILELSGSVSLSSIAPTQSCVDGDKAFLNLPGFCSSSAATLIFSWICTIILLAYLVLIVIYAVLCSDQDHIWRGSVRQLPDRPGIHKLHSAPALSKDYKHGKSKHVSQRHPDSKHSRSRPHREHKQDSKDLSHLQVRKTIVAPKPRRIVPAEVYAYRSGLSPTEYEVEHYHPSKPNAETQPAPATYNSSSTRYTTHSVAAPSLYPEHIQNVLGSGLPRTLPAAQFHHNSGSYDDLLPYGDWPHSNRPIRHARRTSSQSSRQASSDSSHQQHTHSSQQLLGDSAQLSDPLSRSKPTGPRSFSNSSQNGDRRRPPPLDLSNISAYSRRP